MKSIIRTIGICLLLTGATQVLAQDEKDKDNDQQSDKDKKSEFKTAQSNFKAADAVVTKATIQGIDKEKRELSLKKEDGSMVTIKVPESVRKFDQLKTNDVVTAKYNQSVAVAIRKASEPPSATGREITSKFESGEKPGFTKTSTIQISASVEKIDRDKREVTLKGPEGKTRVVKVPEEMKRFDDLKEGDDVVITATESLAIDVTSPNE